MSAAFPLLIKKGCFSMDAYGGFIFICSGEDELEMLTSEERM